MFLSGAQPKAGYLLGACTVVAEVSEEALLKRFNQGWVQEIERDLQKLIKRIAECKRNRIGTSIAYHGNVVDLWEALLAYFNKTGEMLADLGSDQTSLHNPYLGGYFPAQLKYEESLQMMHENPDKFKQLVQER